MTGDASGDVPAEPVRGEPPVLSHDPASTGARDTSVRPVGGPDVGAPETPHAVPTGPVAGLAPEQAAPMLADGPKVRRRRRRGWFASAAGLVVVGVALVATSLLLDGGPEIATGTEASARLGTPLLSARRDPELLGRPVALRAVRSAVDPIVARYPDASCVMVTDGTTQLAAADVAEPLAPASNTKLLTAAAALDVLGADTRLGTTVAAAAAPQDGTVAGDLYLIGGGDPLLSTATATRRMRHGAEPTSSLETLADQVVAAGVRRVTGGVVGDGGRYDDQRTVPTWPARFVSDGTASNLGALMVNDAWTQDPVNPSGAAGGPAADPAAHAADVFATLLRARGVEVAGPAAAGTAPATTTEIASLPSATVAEIVDQMLAFSDNTTAEMLVKELAAHDGSIGSTQAGIQVLVADLTAKGLPVEGLQLFDGSGLSRENRTTCALLDAVLAADGPDGPIAGGLARPGAPGTLDDRFLSEPLRSRVQAKTGTLNDVTALSGWVRTDSGRPLAFSTLQNPAGRRVAASDLALQGELLQALLSYPQAPPVDQLAPTPPVPT